MGYSVSISNSQRQSVFGFIFETMMPMILAAFLFFLFAWIVGFAISVILLESSKFLSETVRTNDGIEFSNKFSLKAVWDRFLEHLIIFVVFRIFFFVGAILWVVIAGTIDWLFFEDTPLSNLSINIIASCIFIASFFATKEIWWTKKTR